LTVVNGSQGATALVGMAGFVVGAQERVEGEWWLYVETTADVVGCSGCGSRAVGHGRVCTAVRDLPVAGTPVVLVWAKRRWRCPERDCRVGTWSERSDAIGVRASLTERARRRLAGLVNVEGRSIAAAGVEFGVGWHTANAAVAEHTDPRIDDPGRLEGVEAIGVDEKRFLNATPTARTRFTTQIVDLDRHRVLDVIEGRSRAVLGDWLTARGDAWCARIRLATLDPAAGYRLALVEHLPNAVRVVDHFHAIQLGNKAIDDVRRRVQQATLGHRGRTADPLYRARRVPLRADERLTVDQFEWMAGLLRDGDPDGEVQAAWVAKELLRDVFSAVDLATPAVGWSCSSSGARRPRSQKSPASPAPSTGGVPRSSPTTRPAEPRTGGSRNLHMLIEQTRRNAHGFTSHPNYRRRILGRHGIQWATVPTRRIRGRQPHSVA
jgi:transposase